MANLQHLEVTKECAVAEFKFSHAHTYRLLEAAEMAEIFLPMGEKPENEGQLRELMSAVGVLENLAQFVPKPENEGQLRELISAVAVLENFPEFPEKPEWCEIPDERLPSSTAAVVDNLCPIGHSVRFLTSDYLRAPVGAVAKVTANSSVRFLTSDYLRARFRFLRKLRKMLSVRFLTSS